MKCYSLPGYKIKYKTTDIFNPYLYYNDSSGIDNTPITNSKTEVDCVLPVNKINPRCIKTKIKCIYEILKTKIPLFLTMIVRFAKYFRAASLSRKLIAIQKYNNSGDDEIVETVVIPKFLANLDCSIFASGASSNEEKTIKANLYVECREFKKEALSKSIPFIKKEIQYLNIIQYIKRDSSYNRETNFIYILLIVNGITSNPEAFEQGTFQILLDALTCLLIKFDEYWLIVEEYLLDNPIYINAIKKDVLIILMQTLANLVISLHFEEIDGYIDEKAKYIQNNGLMLYDKAKKLYSDIKKFSKRLNQFGNGFYSISDSMCIDFFVNPGSLDFSTDDEIYIVDIDDKGIKLLLHSNYMLRETNGYSVQCLIFDSPIVSIKPSEKVKYNTLNTFVDISVNDRNGNEIGVKNIPVNFRPQILFNKKFYKYFTDCLYYDEKSQTFSTDGVETDLNFEYEGEIYIKCTSKHLASFTISNYIDSNAGMTCGQS